MLRGWRGLPALWCACTGRGGPLSRPLRRRESASPRLPRGTPAWLRKKKRTDRQGEGVRVRVGVRNDSGSASGNGNRSRGTSAMVRGMSMLTSSRVKCRESARWPIKLITTFEFAIALRC